MKKWKGSLLLAICLLAMASSMTVCAAGETILKGVSIDKLDVSGMTREEALAATGCSTASQRKASTMDAAPS